MSAIGAVSAHAAPVREATRGVALVGRRDVVAVGVGAEVVALGLEQAEDGCMDRLGYGGTPVPWAVLGAPEPRTLGLLLPG